MIPRDYITEWRMQTPWVQDFQVEQDLVISRALIEIFTHPVLKDALAFRGGTALYKLHIHPPARTATPSAIHGGVTRKRIRTKERSRCAMRTRPKHRSPCRKTPRPAQPSTSCWKRPTQAVPRLRATGGWSCPWPELVTLLSGRRGQCLGVR